jgi:hypothetical protein
VRLDGVSELHLSDPVRLREIPGVRLFAVLWGGLAVIDVSRMIGLGATPQVMTLVMLTFACCVGIESLCAAAVALTGWLVTNGFVAHLDGQLGWAGEADLGRLLLFTLAAVLGTRVRQ